MAASCQLDAVPAMAAAQVEHTAVRRQRQRALDELALGGGVFVLQRLRQEVQVLVGIEERRNVEMTVLRHRRTIARTDYAAAVGLRLERWGVPAALMRPTREQYTVSNLTPCPASPRRAHPHRHRLPRRRSSFLIPARSLDGLAPAVRTPGPRRGLAIYRRRSRPFRSPPPPAQAGNRPDLDLLRHGTPRDHAPGITRTSTARRPETRLTLPGDRSKTAPDRPLVVARRAGEGAQLRGQGRAGGSPPARYRATSRQHCAPSGPVGTGRSAHNSFGITGCPSR